MLPNKHVFDKIDFNGGNLSSDGGAILLMEFIRKLKLANLLSDIPFRDHRRYAIHSNLSILHQLIYRNLLGYHCQSDQKVLLQDSLLSQYVSACSQSSVSRLFDRISYATDACFKETITKQACQFVNKNIVDPILDADSTLIVTNGNQEGAAFIHHYAEVGYHPICINESRSKLLLSARLRTGSAYSSNGVIDELKNVLSFLDNNGNIRFRGDSAFYDTKLMNYLEENSISYYIRAKNFSSLINTVTDDVMNIKKIKEYSYTYEHPFYGEIQYGISGKKSRRVAYKAYWCYDKNGQMNLLPCVYCVVTNNTDLSPKEVMNFYEARGASENFNKELKNDFHAGNLSHSEFNKNEFEFLISAFCYNLFHIYQMTVLQGEDQKIMMNTYRIRYQKVAVKVINHARQVVLSFSSAYKAKETFNGYLNTVLQI